MEAMTPAMAATTIAENGLSSAARPSDHWQRRFGVPWDRVDQAARAVLERAAAASRRRFADLANATLPTEARPG